MQLIMNLGVLMVLHWQRLHRLPKNCKKLSIFSFSGYVALFFFCFHILRNILILVLLNYYFFYTSTECQMVMNVLWTRLGETGKDWRYVYKVMLYK